MKRTNRHVYLLTISLCLVSTPAQAILDWSKLTGIDTSTDFVVHISPLDAKKTQLTKLEEQSTAFSRRYETAQQTVTKRLNNIKAATREAKSSIDKEPEFTELFNKKITILNERKQNLLKIKELWEDIKTTMENNLQLTTNIIKNLSSIQPEEEIKHVYSWQELQDIQNKLNEQISKIAIESAKKENLDTQKITEKENISYIQKQKDNLKQRRKPQKKPNEEEEEESARETDLKGEILNNESNLIDEKIEYSQLNIEKISQEIALKENEIEKLQYEATQTQKLIETIRTKVDIKKETVDLKKTEAENATKKGLAKKAELNKQREPKRLEKERISFEIDNIKQEIARAQEAENELALYFAESKLFKNESHLNEINIDLKLIDAKKQLVDVKASEVELQYKIIDIYYKIKQEKAEENELANLKNQKYATLNKIKQLNGNRDEGTNSLVEATRRIDKIKLKKEEIKQKKETVFKGKPKLYEETLKNLNDAITYEQTQLKSAQEYLSIVSDAINREEKIIQKYSAEINYLESKFLALDIWKRSPRAISFQALSTSFYEIEKFFKELFWNTPEYLGPTNIINKLVKFHGIDFVGIFLFLLFFIVAFIIIKKLLLLLQKKLKSRTKMLQTKKSYIYITMSLQTFTEFCLENYTLLFSWFFIFLHILFNFKYLFASITPLVTPYSLTLFYLISIPILIYLSKRLIHHAKELNKKLSFLFFTEKTQSKFIFLITAILYSTAILIPLRQAFLQYADLETTLPNVILAAYSLILVISILLFFSKEDVLTLIPSKGKFFTFLKEKTEKYYYPVFIFFMGLLILANPYIGYSNLAWYLLFTVPASVFIVYGMFFVHYYIRSYAMKFFLKEEDEDIRDKFDHAKTYYALFVIMSFFILLFFTFIIIARMWRFDYDITSTWQALCTTWVLPIDKPTLGIVQILILIAFITSGFLISSLLHKFVFNKLFDIFRTEPGTQNTIFRITHYIIIALTSTLGFVTIELGGFILVVGGALGIGLGLALKDLVADLVSGFLVLIERSIEIGSYVQLDETTMGTVHKISARATTIRTARNFSVVVPNRDLISKQIINWNQLRRPVGCEITVMVAYDSDTTLVKDLILEVLHNHHAVLKVPTIVFRLENFEENGIQIFVRAFVSPRKVLDLWDIASDIRLGIMDVFRKNNIVIPFPQRVVRFSNKKNGENQPKGIDVKFDEMGQ